MGMAPPKRHPAGAGYGQGNREENSDRAQRQDEKPVTRRGVTLPDTETAADHRRQYSGHEHHHTRRHCEEESAQDSHTYCSRVTRIHSSI